MPLSTQRELSNGSYIQLEDFDDGATIVIGIGPNLKDMTFAEMTVAEARNLVHDLQFTIG